MHSPCGALRGRLLFTFRAGLLALAGINFACGSGSGTIGQNNGFPVLRSFILVTNSGDNTLSRYALDNERHVTGLIGTTPVGRNPQSVVTADANGTLGHYVYVANFADNTISQFLGHTDGSLTPLSPPTVPTGREPVALATGEMFDRDFVRETVPHVYCANRAGKSISVFTITKDGTLHPVSTVGMDSAPSGIAVQVTSNGGAVFAISAQDNTLSQFQIVPDAQNGLKRAAPFTFTNGDGKAGIGAIGGYALYIINTNDKTFEDYTLKATSGNYLINKLAATRNTADNPVALALDRSTHFGGVGSTAYIATANGKLLEYDLNLGLNAQGSLPVGAVVGNPTTVDTFDPQPVFLRVWDGQYLFSAQNFENRLVTYYKDKVTTSLPTGKGPTSLAILEVGNRLSNVVTTVK